MSNEKKSLMLGMPHGTAQHKLRKSILFSLLVKYGQNKCYRCEKEIVNIDQLSIEHKKAWLNSENPKELFFDLENIAFSHLKCNFSAVDKSFMSNIDYRTKHSIGKFGEGNPASKLSDEEVNQIQADLLNDKLGVRELARKYRISHNTIIRIRDGIRGSALTHHL